jgi:hypothetical protein
MNFLIKTPGGPVSANPSFERVLSFERHVGMSTIEQNVDAPTIALANSKQCSKSKEKLLIGVTKMLFHVKQICFER